MNQQNNKTNNERHSNETKANDGTIRSSPPSCELHLNYDCSFGKVDKSNNNSKDEEEDVFISLFYDPTKQLLFAGNEGGYIQIWDTKDKQELQILRTAIFSKEEGKDGNIVQTVVELEDPVTSICRRRDQGSNDDDDHCWLASAGTCIYSLTKSSSSTTMTDNNDENCGEACFFQLEVLHDDESREEINQLCTPSKKQRPYVAVANDSGHIDILTLESSRSSSRTNNNNNNNVVVKTIRGKHTTMCSCLTFSNNHPWYMISGGYDCCLVVTDFSNYKTIWCHNMNEMIQNMVVDDPNQQNQIVNPPFVQTIALLPSSSTKNKSSKARKKGTNNESILVGLGNGTFCEVLVKTGKMLAVQIDAHSSGIVQIYPLVSSEEDNDGAWIIVTLGNDQMIKIWKTTKRKENDTSSSTGDDKVTPTNTYTLLTEKRHPHKLNAVTAMPRQQQQQQQQHRPNHHDESHCFSALKIDDADDNNDNDKKDISDSKNDKTYYYYYYTLFVADVTNCISTYTFYI